MIEIPLTQGKIALIDDEDFDLVSQFTWHAFRGYKNLFYAANKKHRLLMHRLVLGAKIGEKVDHKNGNSLDNRRENLRIATTSQNAANWKHRDGKFKGVCLEKRTNTWISYIKKDGKTTYLGSFALPEEAAQAYDDKAKELFGEFASLNLNIPIIINNKCPHGLKLGKIGAKRSTKCIDCKREYLREYDKTRPRNNKIT